jgi:hypothetical protein
MGKKVKSEKARKKEARVAKKRCLSQYTRIEACGSQAKTDKYFMSGAVYSDLVTRMDGVHVAWLVRSFGHTESV